LLNLLCGTNANTAANNNNIYSMLVILSI